MVPGIADAAAPRRRDARAVIAVLSLAAAALAVPSYLHAPCPFTPAAGARVDCGRLTVRENRARPDTSCVARSLTWAPRG
jgi:hypothetical protein